MSVDKSFLKLSTKTLTCSYVRKHNQCGSEMMQCVVSNIKFFQQIVPSSVDRKKRTFFKKKLNINNYDEAQDGRIKDAVKAFVETRGLKRAESESPEDKKPEMI